MITPASQLKGLPIISLEANEPIGAVIKPVIDPSDLRVDALFCKSDGGSTARVLLMRDIRQISDELILVNSESDLVEFDDIIRLRATIRANFDLVDKTVITESGHKLGVVRDFSINYEAARVQSLFVGPKFFGSQQFGHNHIDRNQIINVTDTKIVVQDTTETETAPSGMIPDAAA